LQPVIAPSKNAALGRPSRRQQVEGEGTRRAGNVTPLQFAESRKCLQNRLGSVLAVGRACRLAVWA
jgi:hypothetical protein